MFAIGGESRDLAMKRQGMRIRYSKTRMAGIIEVSYQYKNYLNKDDKIINRFRQTETGSKIMGSGRKCACGSTLRASARRETPSRDFSASSIITTTREQEQGHSTICTYHTFIEFEYCPRGNNIAAMSTVKRRKVTATTSRKPTSSSRGIAAFTRVSKSQVISNSVYDKIDRLETSETAQPIESDRKRKILRVEEVDTSTVWADQASAILSAVLDTSERAIKPLPQRSLTTSQKLAQTLKQHISIPQACGPEETPTKDAKDILDSLPSCSSTKQEHISNNAQQLPSELHDLINLHASFLTALTLHHAHNGAHAPADLRLLCPNVARAWGKRRVLLSDIQRTLGVVNISKIISGLTLSDYGHGKICVESKPGSEKPGQVARVLDENQLNDAFVRELRKLWEERDRTLDSVTDFIETLPLESITICSSLAKMSPLLAKGQRRLEDLRAGIILKRQIEKEEPVVVLSKEDGGRRPTLLERLKAKQLLQSTLPPPPSKAELGRKAALHRLEEVVSVLTLLTTSTSIGQSRVSFTMPTVLGKLRDSFKMPMSKEEGDTCVRLLASEVAPEWLRIVKMGKVDAVVVNRDNRPSDLDIKERIKRSV